ncbi:hypothetical protein L1987_01252 [Smallanthus sonchifolius]|uniref:Uncharacterized protein n=1 Tax=Smallanthus sonchifolius TaxID=185202 RepID=A0ACB9K4H7_9ASTR|nr:hypothetical protein L1987_01252 [Smallanthus sonchifolius]
MEGPACDGVGCKYCDLYSDVYEDADNRGLYKRLKLFESNHVYQLEIYMVRFWCFSRSVDNNTLHTTMKG